MSNYRINGIQHLGIAVQDMDASLKYYRKFFGLDIPFFDAVAAAPLMDIYTRNKTITKRASMILNLQGGCAVEVIRPTSFEPKKAAFDLRLGDLGIYIAQVKSRNIERSHEFCKKENALELSELKTTPSGQKTFFMKDLDGLLYQFVEAAEWFTKNKRHSGGIKGCTIGVSDMDRSLKLYADILGYDQLVYDETGVFEDWKGLPGGDEKYRRVLLEPTQMPGGGFAKLQGQTAIELVQALDRKPRWIFEDRIWADTGFVHLGFDVRGMAALGEKLEEQGFGFTCDSNDALDMGNTKVHCTYIDDPDQTWIEMIEVYKVPIVEKWGLYLNVEKRSPSKPLPDFMLKALKFSRIKD